MTTPSETINTTHDKNWDYKKVILEDGTVEYFFIGSRGKYKQNFPNWVKTVDDGGSGTIRRNAIMVGVFGDSLDPTFQNETPINKIFKTPPETSQTSNIIENSEDPNANNLYGTVVDSKTLNPIKGANLKYGSLSTITDEEGKFIIELPSRKPIDPINPPPEIPDECINTKHDSAYNYKRLSYSDGRVDYYFIGVTGEYKQNFPNWTEAPIDTLVGKTTGTVNRDAIVEKVKFDCPPPSFSFSSQSETPSPTLPENPSSQLRQITGTIQTPPSDNSGGYGYGWNIRLVKNNVGDITSPPYQTNSDPDSKFQLSIPINGLFLQAKKPNSTQTIILPITSENNYNFDFSTVAGDGIVQEQVEVPVTASRLDLEVSATNYATLSVSVIKGDNTLKNNLGVIPLVTTLVSLDEEVLESIIFTPKETDQISEDKKDWKHFLKQKIIDLLKKLKIILLPIILGMIAKFGVTQLQKIIESGKDKKDDFLNDITCPPKEDLDRLIKRKNKLVKQLNNVLKIIESTTKALGITGNVILILDIAFKILKNLPLPTAVPPGIGLPTNVVLGIQDNKDKISKIITTLKGLNTSTLVILNLLRETLIKVIKLLQLLDQLIQHCYPDTDPNSQEQISSELIALTQEQANQQSPVVTIVNNFTMGVETEKTTNTLKRRRATATNAGGVVMLKGEWSFSSIDQILIDELVFYIQINDLKAD